MPTIDVEAVLRELTALLAEVEPGLERGPGALPGDARWSELGLDSAAAVELLARVEERFDVVIPEEDALHLTTPGALARFVARQVGR